MEGDEETSFRHIPKSQSMLVFGFGQPAHVDDGDQTCTMEESFVLPIFTTSTRARLHASSLIGVSFVKDGLYRLVKQSIPKLRFNIPSPLKEKIAGLRESFNGKTLEAISGSIQQFLIPEMDLEAGPVGFEEAIGLIEKSKGCLSIEQVCKEAGISSRSLQRHFNERIGISPKRYAKITRVNALLNELLTREPENWMEKVVSLNYHDQPHLVNEFKSIIKLSPRALLKYRDSLYHQVQ